KSCSNGLHLAASLVQRRVELLAGADAELPEDLSQVPLDRSRAEEQLGAYLRVRVPLARKLGDLCFLSREIATSLRGTFACLLAGGEKLSAGSLRECLHPDRGEKFVRGVQLFARVNAPAGTTQPFSVQQVRTRSL